MNKTYTHLLLLLPLFIFFSGWFLSDKEDAPAPVVAVPTVEDTAVGQPIMELPTVAEPKVEEPAESMPACNCTVTQGNFTSPLPFLSSNSTAVDFYSYGNPIGVSANTGLEMSETLLIMMHEDANTGNTSLIVILDQANDGSGGSADITFNCLPPSAFVDLSDDPGELSGTPPVITGAFGWAPCCTDGGVIGGVGCGNTITINPNIGSGINTFSLVYGLAASPGYVTMPQSDCPITINCGGAACCAEAFEFTAVTQDASCTSSGDGSIDLTMDCATIPTFIWSNGAVTEDLMGIGPGNYSVTITDANGCTQTDAFVINANAPNPQPSITGPAEFCTGEIAELGVSGAYVDYVWSNGSFGSPIFVTDPGIYTVTVTNAAGCTGTASTTLSENPLPVANITGPTSICADDTITLDAGPGFASYEWSTSENSQTIEITEYGGYYLTVTNSFGCTAIDFTVVEPLPSPSPTITGPDNVCSGNPVTLDAGTGFDTYLWSTGSNSQSISVNMAGTYSVTVTNADNCDGTASQVVTENPADSIFLYQSSCNPADTGIFIQQFQNQYGCDSLEILTVSFSESDSVFLFDESCNPADTGIFVQTFTNQYGCDSVEIEEVSLLPSDDLYLTDYSCSPQDTGVAVQNLINQSGCDSIVTTTTLLLPTDTVQVSAQSCDPANAGVTEELYVNMFGCDSLVITTTQFILVDTTNLYDTTCDPAMAGEFEDLYTSSEGCDSLVITTVELILADTTYLTANTCDISQAGQSEELLSNQAGCDSLIITTLTYIPPDTTMLFSESCDPAAAGVSEEILVNSFGCDSLVITTVSLLPTDTTALAQTSCDPNLAGTEEFLLMNQYGCDSIVILTTTFAEADSTQVNNTTCDPSEAGTSVEVLLSSDGCDSVITTITTLLPSDTVQVFAESCDPSNTGITETLLSNQYGCDSLVITTTTLLPSDTTYLQAITCDIGQAGQTTTLEANQYGCDSLIVTNTTYIPPDTTLLFAETCDPDEAGIEEIYLQNSSGCDSVIITTTELLNSDTTVLQAFSCDPGQVGASSVLLSNTSGCDSLVITITDLLPTDTTWLVSGSCSPMDTGLVITQLSNQYGCDSLVFEQTGLLPASECQLDAQIAGDTIGCQENTGSLWLTFFSGTPPYQYIWSDNNGNSGSGSIDQGGSPQQIGGLPPGAYTFEILDPGGLMTTMSATIFQPDPLQINLQLQAEYNGYGVSCFGASDGSASVTVQDGGLPPYTYNWSNGSQSLQANGLGSGWHSVTVTGAEGCTAIDSILVDSPDSIYFNLQLAHPDCFTEGFGAIVIEEVAGGTEPYQYALDNGQWQPDPLFDGLSSGGYLAVVEDANNCTASALAFINSFIQPTVSLGQDTSLLFGDSIRLQLLTNLPYFLLDSIYWEGLDCPGCTDVTVAPIATSNYSVTVVDSLGCSASDALQVVVKKDFQVFAPNAFSPNDDGFNDKFTIYGGPQVVRIQELQIFSRWGEPVFTGFNLPPNDPSYGWDGYFRSEPMDAAVFVFFAVVEFADGSSVLVEGDVTLVR